MFLEKDIQIENFCLLSGILPLKIYNNLYNSDKFRKEINKIGGVTYIRSPKGGEYACAIPCLWQSPALWAGRVMD